MMKKETVDKLLIKFNRSLDAIECGMYAEFDTGTIIDKLIHINQNRI